jgi:hypothetical protein
MILEQVSDFTDMTEDEKSLTFWNAEQLHAAGMAAIMKTKCKIDKSKIRQAEKKIDQVCKNKNQFDVAEMLSFLFLGLNDLGHYCNDKRVIKDVEDAALNFITVFDPNLEDTRIHEEALNKYGRWVQS